MALSITKKDDAVPTGGIRLTRDLALQYQRKLIQKWEPLSDVFALRVGPGVLGAISGVSSIMILRHFRKKLKLGVYGSVTSYFPAVLLPSFFAAVVHTTFVQPKILLSEFECPICLQTKATIFQLAVGLVYPFMLAPMASFLYATRHFTVRLPYLTEEPKAWLKLWWKLTRSGKKLAGYVLVANLLGAMIITPLELNEIVKLRQKLQEHEKNVENGSLLIE